MKLDAKAWFAIILIAFFIISSAFALFSPPSFVENSKTAAPTPGAQPSFEARALATGEVVALTPSVIVRCTTNNSLALQAALRGVQGVQSAVSLGSGLFSVALSKNATLDYGATKAGLAVLRQQCDNSSVTRTALITINESAVELQNPFNSTQTFTIASKALSRVAALNDCFEKTCGLKALVAEEADAGITLPFLIVGSVQQGQLESLVIGQAQPLPKLKAPVTANSTGSETIPFEPLNAT